MSTGVINTRVQTFCLNFFYFFNKKVLKFIKNKNFCFLWFLSNCVCYKICLCVKLLTEKEHGFWNVPPLNSVLKLLSKEKYYMYKFVRTKKWVHQRIKYYKLYNCTYLPVLQVFSYTFVCI